MDARDIIQRHFSMFATILSGAFADTLFDIAMRDIKWVKTGYCKELGCRA